MEVEDAFALEDILPEEIDTYLDEASTRRRQLRKAEAEFKQSLTAVLVEAIEIRKDTKSAQFFLKRATKDRNQLSLRFEGSAPATLTLEMPDNGRTSEAAARTTDPIRE